jgi:hypothetical protein
VTEERIDVNGTKLDNVAHDPVNTFGIITRSKKADKSVKVDFTNAAGAPTVKIVA